MYLLVNLKFEIIFQQGIFYTYILDNISLIVQSNNQKRVFNYRK